MNWYKITKNAQHGGIYGFDRDFVDFEGNITLHLRVAKSKTGDEKEELKEAEAECNRIFSKLQSQIGDIASRCEVVGRYNGGLGMNKLTA